MLPSRNNLHIPYSAIAIAIRCMCYCEKYIHIKVYTDSYRWHKSNMYIVYISGKSFK